MLNYIKAELYRNFNRVYFWGWTVGITMLVLILNIVLKVNDADMDLSKIFITCIYLLNMGIYLVLPILDMTTAEEQKNQTLKNVVSFGISRSKLVLSKIIIAFILSFIAMAIILTVFLGSGAILFGTGGNFSVSLLNTFSIRLLVSIVLWTGAISVGTFLALFFKNNNVFSFVYVGAFLMSIRIIRLLSKLVWDKIIYVNKFLITTQFGKMVGETVSNNTLIFASVVGVVYTIVFAILAMLYVKNMEVK